MNRGFQFFILIAVVLSWCALSYGQPISSSELINNARLYDGKPVVYSGEAVGDVMVRGDYAWVNFNDGQNAIGIWLPKNLIQDIAYTGSYKSRGDWFEISGTFQRACVLHGGDLDIHAQAMRKVTPGRESREYLNIAKRNQVFILTGILCLVLILRLFRPRQTPR